MDHHVENIFNGETILRTILNSHRSVDALLTQYPKLLLPLELYEANLSPIVLVEDVKYSVPLELPDSPHNTRQVKLYPCSECSSIYLLKRKLKEHLNVHHMCQFCNTVFPNGYSLDHHQQRFCRKSSLPPVGVEPNPKEMKHIRGLLKPKRFRCSSSSTQTKKWPTEIEDLPGGRFGFKNLRLELARHAIPLKLRQNGRINSFKTQVCRNQPPKPRKQCDLSGFEVCDVVAATSMFSFVQCFPLSSNAPHLSCHQVKLLDEAVQDAPQTEMSWQDFKDITDSECAREVIVEGGRVYGDCRKARVMQSVIGDVVEVKSRMVKVLAPALVRGLNGVRVKEEEEVKHEGFESVFLVD